MILLLGLDEVELNETRKHYMDIYHAFQDPVNAENRFVASQYEWAFNYPRSIPDLKGKHPPGNRNKRSVNKCCFQLLRGIRVPTVYF